jgi:redox-sensitive bicupin YhaK (pirin superfamily)
MIRVRRDSEIYDKEGGWFHARWHFSFDEYRDPNWTQFGSLRVFNDDRLIPGVAWPMHPHRDIEGITYVVEGTFRHADNLGAEYPLLPAGSAQRMSLGSGAWHSEQNASDTEGMRFIQMWIIPNERGLEPSVEQRVFTQEDRRDRLLRVVAGPERVGDAVLVHQDASVYAASLTPGASIQHELRPGGGAYVYVIGGGVELSGGKLILGDAAAISEETSIDIQAIEPTELIMVEVRLD